MPEKSDHLCAASKRDESSFAHGKMDVTHTNYNERTLELR